MFAPCNFGVVRAFPVPVASPLAGENRSARTLLLGDWMRQLLTLILALALFAVACGGSDSDSETTNSGDADSSQNDNDNSESDSDGDDEAVAEGLSVDTINVAYFEQWPTPNLLGFNDGSFDAAVGAEINWVPFGSGGEMSEVMEAGDIDISYSQGLTPFANTVNNGADIKLVGIAVTYAEADNCVAQGHLGVTRDRAADVLDGATVMTPSGNVTNFKMLTMMDFLGVNISSLTILPTDGGSTTAAAFAAGDIDVGCSFGGSLVDMLEASDGELIMTGAEQASDIGINTYDIVSIPTSFGQDHRDAVVAFLRATQQFNEKWAADPAGSNGTIAEASGMEDVGNFLSGPTWFSFPSLQDQLGDAWMGATVALNMTEQVQTFVDLGQIDSTIGDFSGAVDSSFLEAALG